MLTLTQCYIHVHSTLVSTLSYSEPCPGTGTLEMMQEFIYHSYCTHSFTPLGNLAGLLTGMFLGTGRKLNGKPKGNMDRPSNGNYGAQTFHTWNLWICFNI